MRIFLLGFMGAGKSYWAKKMADNFALHCLDLDTVIEKQEQQSIAQIFETEGETKFRQLEQYHLQQCCLQEDNLILALGGGTPCFFDNMQWINKYSCSIFLDFPADFLIQNLLLETEKRPLLKGKNVTELQQLIQQKMDERYPFYHRAQFRINNPETAEQDLVSIINKKIPS